MDQSVNRPATQIYLALQLTVPKSSNNVCVSVAGDFPAPPHEAAADSWIAQDDRLREATSSVLKKPPAVAAAARGVCRMTTRQCLSCPGVHDEATRVMPPVVKDHAIG